MLLGFADRRVERAFQLHYGWPACAVGLGAAVMGLLVHGVLVLRALLLPDASPMTTAQILHTSVSLATAANFLIMYAVLGKERFVLSRGIHSVWHRLLFATGVLFYSRPSDCAAAGYCRMLWKHGLLFVHVVGSLGRNPSGLYWFGGVVSWLAAVAVDVADPGVTCETIVCVLAALQAQAAADPKLLLHNMMRMCMRSSRVFALDVVLPGLLLTWLELRARRAWWQQQQQARQQQALRQLRSEAAANKKQQAAAAAVASAQAAAGPSSRTAVTQPQAKRILRQQQQQQQPVSTGNHKPGVHCDPSRQAANQLPVQAETAAAAASTQAPQPASSPAVAAAAALAAAPAGAVQVQAGAALSLPAAAAEMLPAALPGPRRGSVLYRSPVQRSIVSLKFSKAPGPGAQDNAVFQQQVAGAVQAAVQQAAADAAPYGAAGDEPAQQQEQPAVMVSGVAAFPGCYQLVMHVVAPQGQVIDSQLPELQQQIQCAAQGVLETYYGLADCSLLSTQLQPALPEMAMAGAVPAAAAAVLAADTAEAGSAMRLTGVLAAAAGVYMHPVVALPDNRCGNSTGTPEGAAVLVASTFNVCIAQPTVVQVLQAGHSSVRVVVTSQLPGAALADNTWQLPSAAAVSEDVAFPLRLHCSSLEGANTDGQQPVVLSVVVLAAHTPMDEAAVAPADVSPSGQGNSSSDHTHAAVLAKLPLLVLPPAAASDLQALATGLTAEQGLAPAAAYQELLPLLQDLAVVLTHHGSSPRPSTSSAGPAVLGQLESSQQALLQSLVAALLACFEQQGMVHCMHLLHGLVKATDALLAAGSPQIAPAMISGERQGSDAVVTETGLGPAGAAAGSAAGSAVRRSTGSAGVLMIGRLASLSSHGSGSSGSSGKNSSFSNSNTGVSSKLTGSSSYQTMSSCQEAEADLPTGQQQQQQQQARQTALGSGAIRLGFGTLVFGFLAGMEAAYCAYKSGMLRNSDFLSMLSYSAGLFASSLKMACAVMSSSAVQARVTALRAGFLIIHVITHALMWAASTGAVPQLILLQQWRDAVLVGGVTLALCMFAGVALCEGVWGAAGVTALQGSKTSAYWVFMLYRHVVQPTWLRIGLLPWLLLAAEFLAVDTVFVRPRLPWLGPGVTALLLVFVQSGIAAALEVSVRRSFVRSLRQR